MTKEINVYANKTDPPADDPPDLESLLTLLRLLVGGVAEGADELLRRLREQQQALSQNRASTLTIFPADETDLNRLRYALLGLLFETPGTVARSLGTVTENSRRAAGLMAKLTRPVTNSWLLRPAKRRFDQAAARGEALVERLAAVGRLEEQQGRLLARQAGMDVLDELLAYLAEKPEIRQMVQQQGMSLTGEVVRELRQRTAAADDLLERLLGRRKAQPPEVVEMPALKSRSQSR